ncbi:penicillin-binding protein 1c [Leptolyngbya sp. Heron Island J]|uniref:penicillin-binding protein 1C n=1 Tax=Leptolyngbya sp. Heron Island J TaxID=1385935 RepID=UPI0003B99BCB|nr:penicillin-binding protein 1C [Leptolyngbya sp. Heron Island J]ESA34446.1 penicillin-binding protein 1c [Leptolyngbya sp. Heron Island J]
MRQSLQHLCKWCRSGLWQQSWWVKTGLSVLLVGFTVRGLPYLMPIHAADLAQVDQAVDFRDRNSLPLGTLLSRDQEHTAVVPLSQISPHFRNAILAAEDRRFYQRGPVDLQALVRASLQAIRTRRIVSGGSTVTMQLARMVHSVPRTFLGKTQQIWYAWRLAAGMTKDEILTAYVNRLPMGGNIYGVEAAARVYFGVSAADLTVAQASLLAALPNAPSALNPYTSWDRLKQRQQYVLNQMVADGSLNRAQAKRIYAQAVTLQPVDQGLLVAPHFLFWLADRLPPDHAAQIQTSLDLSLQRFVTAQVQQAVRGLAPKHVRHAAALVVDNATGEVLAYVGSPSYFSLQQTGQNDGVQALRQPGSTLKPFLYQLALEQDVIQPNSILADVPTHYAIPGAQLYSPTDFSETFQGPVRMRAALGNSLNIPAVRVLEQVGVDNFLDHLHQLGFSHLDQSPDHYGLGLALGSGEVTLWELAQAYLTLAHQGDPSISLSPFKVRRENNALPVSHSQLSVSPLPRGTDRGFSIFGTIDWDPSAYGTSPSKGEESLRPASPTWALITDILADPYARATAFGVDSVLNLPFPAAVKTGTSSDFRDTWTVGFTSDYTVATWVGNFDGTPMQDVSGVMGAAPLWHRIMVHLHETQEPERFTPPAGMVKRPICALTGQRPTSDCEAVVQEYFALEDLAAYEQSATELSQADIAVNNASLTIVSPKAGSQFLLYPDSSDQRLEFKMVDDRSQTSSPIEWRLNGESLETSGETSLFWSMQPGHWNLEVRSGDRQTQVQFDVTLADEQLIRAGFSLRKSQ